MKFLSLLLAITSLPVFASNYVVEFKQALNAKQLKALANMQVESFDFDSDYFKRVYSLETNLSKPELEAKLQAYSVVAIEDVHKVTSMSIEPANDLARYSSTDELLAYQWGLVAQGQRTRLDKDDVNFVMISGSDKSDINFVKAKSLLSSDIVSIAVLDTGVDLGHPDLRDIILKNDVECKSDGAIDPETRDDNDDNGVPGDCLGWNFTVHKNDPRAKLPMDDVGHGTHVAGIIAGQVDNDVGVHGLGKNLRILPVKVLSADESSPEARTIALTDRIARGILYAIKRDVRVINLSLGWLRQADTKYLREAVNAALARGIAVVAAAGNNGANARLYPCSYPGVVCVGATRIDGKLASFSNFGGNVDVYAPGESILSTWPLNRVPLDFSLHGYEIQNGTSQATPYVSGSIAQLIAKNPQIKIPEIQARVALSPNARLDLYELLTASEQSVVRPVFKSLDEISYTLKQRRFRVPLPIVNYWQEVSDVKVRFSTEHKGIALVQSEFDVKSLKEAATATLPLEGQITDVSADRTFVLNVEIQIGEQTRTYRHEMHLVRLLIQDEDVIESVVEFKDGVKPLAIVQNDSLSPLVTTSESFYGTAAPEWFLRKNSDSAIDLSFFSYEDGKIKEKQTVNLAGAKRILGLINMDFNGDAKDDRLFRTTKVNADGEETAIVYSYRMSDGAALDIEFVPDVAVANETLAFTKHSQIPAPVFATVGTLPEKQQPTSFFATRDEATRQRLYVLVPNDNRYETVSIDTQEQVEKWKSELGLRFSEPYVLHTILSPSLEDHQKGIVRALVSFGRGSKKVDAVIEVTSATEFKLVKQQSSSTRLDAATPVRVSRIDGSRYARHELTGFVNFYDTKRARLSVIEEKLNSKTYRVSDEFDALSSHIASFVKDGKITSAYTTLNRLILVSDNGVLERALDRFDFIPGAIFNELFFPVAKESQGELIPALYVDASAIHSPSVHVIEVHNDQIVAPMKQSLLLPPNCKALNPVILTGETSHRSSLICLEKERGFVFKFVK